MAGQQIILGVPSDAYYARVLGGRPVPLQDVSHIWERISEPGKPYPYDCCRVCGETDGCGSRSTGEGTCYETLILFHPGDAETGAMGLARLAWIAVPSGVTLQWGSPVWRTSREHGMWFVRLDWGQDEDDVPEWCLDNVPALRDATCAEEAIGLVCVHLGILDRTMETPLE